MHAPLVNSKHFLLYRIETGQKWLNRVILNNANNYQGLRVVHVDDTYTLIVVDIIWRYLEPKCFSLSECFDTSFSLTTVRRMVVTYLIRRWCSAVGCNSSLQRAHAMISCDIYGWLIPSHERCLQMGHYIRLGHPMFYPVFSIRRLVLPWRR